MTSQIWSALKIAPHLESGALTVLSRNRDGRRNEPISTVPTCRTAALELNLYASSRGPLSSTGGQGD